MNTIDNYKRTYTISSNFTLASWKGPLGPYSSVGHNNLWIFLRGQLSDSHRHFLCFSSPVFRRGGHQRVCCAKKIVAGRRKTGAKKWRRRLQSKKIRIHAFPPFAAPHWKSGSRVYIYPLYMGGKQGSWVKSMHVHTAYPCCISLLHVTAAFPCCLYTLHVRSKFLSFMSMLCVHAAHPYDKYVMNGLQIWTPQEN